MTKFSIIVAMDEKNGIGKQGDLAWRLSYDLKHFKAITTKIKQEGRQNAVIMGRKTWDSLPEKFKPLPGRLNVVLSRNLVVHTNLTVAVYSGLDVALHALSSQDDVDQIFVMGGAQIYAQAIHHPCCEGLYVTHVKGDFDCDVFFPAIPDLFKKLEESPSLVEGSIPYQFVHYQRVS